jgi:glycosyltransferase involved in cell wall biosynthesis
MSQTSVHSVDVIVPVLNRETTIGRTVQSILDQTYRDLLVWIVDDGSTDGTLEILRAVDDHRITVLHQDHGGPAAARNAGVAAGMASHVAFVDSDDVVRPEWLATLLDADSEAGLTRCSGQAYRSGVATDRLTPRTRSLLPGLFLVRRDLFEDVGGYDERFRFSENTDLQIRLERSAQGHGLRIVEIDEVLIDVYMAPDGKSLQADPRRVRDAAELFIAKHGADLESSPRHLGSLEAVAGYNSLVLGERKRARSHLRTATALAPRKLKYRIRLWQTYLPRMRSAPE